LAEQVQSSAAGGHATFAVSGNGLLVFQSGGAAAGSRLAWFDRSGKRIGTLGDPSTFGRVHFSANRKSVAVSIVDRASRNEYGASRNEDIWIYDLSRSLPTRFTFDPATEDAAIWSPDGSSIVFSSNRKGHFDLYRKASSGTGSEELLYADNLEKQVEGWSPDGKFIVYRGRGDPKYGDDVWILPVSGGAPGDRKPFPFAQTTFGEQHGQFSPDGKWIAYASNESGRNEIYVTPFPGPGGKRQVSTRGGTLPRWRNDGKEIFYAGFDGVIMAAEVNIKGSTVAVTAVRPMFGRVNVNQGFQFDVSADGQRFLAVVAPEQDASGPMTLVQNWAATLLKK
jgi:Tol biopolymer transport system component